jgi:hypothetical protein
MAKSLSTRAQAVLEGFKSGLYVEAEISNHPGNGGESGYLKKDKNKLPSYSMLYDRVLPATIRSLEKAGHLVIAREEKGPAIGGYFKNTYFTLKVEETK